MGEVLMVKDKYETYVISNERGVEWAALDLLMKRLDEGYWYDDWDDGDDEHQWEQRAKEIVAQRDANAALDFLTDRRDHEYEWVEVQTVR